MKTKLLLILVLMAAFLQTFAQVDKMLDVLDDETDMENYTLRFRDALNGSAVFGASIKIDDVGEYVTDPEGKIKFPRTMEEGKITVHFSAEGYISTSLVVEIIAGSIFSNRISVSPEMAMEWVRIILDWGNSPKDLDAHLEKKDQYHVSFRNMKTSQDGSCQLDRDDTKGYGPETITVKEIETSASYEYWVHDYTNLGNDNSRQLSRSGATVKVYGNGQLLGNYSVPKDSRGNAWKVFEIRDGQIVPTNYVSSSPTGR